MGYLRAIIDGKLISEAGTHSLTASSAHSWPWQRYISTRRTAVWFVHPRLGRAYYVNVYACAETTCVSGSTHSFTN